MINRTSLAGTIDALHIDGVVSRDLEWVRAATALFSQVLLLLLASRLASQVSLQMDPSNVPELRDVIMRLENELGPRMRLRRFLMQPFQIQTR